MGEKPNDESGSFMYALSDVKLCAPIPRPSKNVICIGKNYRDHAVEMGSEADIPEHPMVLRKPRCRYRTRRNSEQPLGRNGAA